MLPSEYVKKGWCQGQNAIDTYGNPVDIESANCDAVAWCMMGAIDAANVDGTLESKGISHSDYVDATGGAVLFKRGMIAYFVHKKR